MNLLPGCRLTVAPHFHMPINWSERLQLGAGLEQAGSEVLPRLPWRAPADYELAMLIRDPSLSATQEDLLSCLSLFNLPKHLRLRFWKMLEQSQERGETRLAEFDIFAAEVANFLVFKQMAVPRGAAFDLLVSAPGQQAVLRFAPEESPRSPWAGINLGDEPTWLVFVNLPLKNLLCNGSDYPPIRLRLEPGEGYRMPVDAMLASGCTVDKQEPDLLLLVSSATS